MPLSRSATSYRAALAAVVVFTLAATGVLGHRAIAAPSASSVKSTLITLEQSATAVPLGGEFGFTGVVDLPEGASEVQARLQIRLPSGKLVFQRTKYEVDLKPGRHEYSFSRELAGLGLKPGAYPVAFSARTVVADSPIETETVTTLRIYDPKRQPVRVVVLAKIHSRPLVDSAGRFAVDPATPEALRARGQIDRISALVSADASAAITLSVPPALLEQWRRIASDGYTLTSGTVVPATDPVAVGYGATLSNMQNAIATGRLELLTSGYSDPNLADLVSNRMVDDASTQYDAGLSACFASIAATPSAGTAPAGGCVPRAMQNLVAEKGVAYTFADAKCSRQGKRPPATGVYPCADSKLKALIIDTPSSQELESGESSAVIARTLERQTGPIAYQPFIVRIDLDDAVNDATATVGFALATLESSPWVRLALGKDVRLSSKARSVRFEPSGTVRAPAGYWPRIRTARADAEGLLAILSASDTQAAAAQTNSLLAQADAWSGPRGTWRLAKPGLDLADSAIRSAKGLFSAISISAQPMTLASSTGEVPITIRNNSNKTLNVVVVATTGGGARVARDRLIRMALPPRETFILIPVDMQSALRGRLTVQVMAGQVTIAKQSVPVSRSYLDRLALIGGVVVVLGGMLLWIVFRVRRSPSIETDDEEPTPAGPCDDSPTEPISLHVEPHTDDGDERDQ